MTSCDPGYFHNSTMVDILSDFPVSVSFFHFCTRFKVKLTPSSGKRGKAAKTAVQVFLADKATLPRQRDLIKSVKLDDATRNFPGKVKVTVPQAARPKKR